MAFKSKTKARQYQYAWVREKYASDPAWVRRRNDQRAERRSERLATESGLRGRMNDKGRENYRKVSATPVGRLKRLVNGARTRSRQRGLAFEISLDDLGAPPVACPVLGIKLNYGPGGTRDSDRASIDRIEGRKGYVPGNVRVISYRANSLKSDATAAELRAVVRYMEGKL